MSDVAIRKRVKNEMKEEERVSVHESTSYLVSRAIRPSIKTMHVNFHITWRGDTRVQEISDLDRNDGPLNDRGATQNAGHCRRLQISTL